MTYASNTRRPNPVALAGALGIPAAVAALLVVGLAVKVVIAPEPPALKGFTVKPIPIPPAPAARAGQEGQHRRRQPAAIHQHDHVPPRHHPRSTSAQAIPSQACPG